MSERSNLEQVKRLPQYQVVKEADLKELNSRGMILEHKKSGARLFLLANEDENKVFNIGFRTPPADSTRPSSYSGTQCSGGLGEIPGEGTPLWNW